MGERLRRKVELSGREILNVHLKSQIIINNTTYILLKGASESQY